MASTSGNLDSSLKVSTEFTAPAQEPFDTFLSQSKCSMDNYFPDWRNYDHPKSYMIPPIFSYQRPDVSDEAVQKVYEQQLKTINQQQHEIVKNRLSDDAEFVFYKALDELNGDGILAPIVAVHHLDMNKIQHHLPNLFPNNAMLLVKKKQGEFRDCFREYDFVLLGPKIGIVFVEAKSSCQEKNYKYGRLVQLNSAETLLRLLEECTTNEIPNEIEECTTNEIPNEIKPKKILFLPAVEKPKNFGEDPDLIHLFQEDRKNSDVSGKPPFYTAIRSALEKGNPIPLELFESYARVISAFASTVIFRMKGTISENEAVLKVHSRMQSQNPLEGHKSEELSEYSLLKEPSYTLSSCTSKSTRSPIGEPVMQDQTRVIYLTPDQQKALRGPLRQFIFGAAGTGKTIVLQAKVLELLDRGQKVTVIATNNFVDQYERLFANYESDKYCVWSKDKSLAKFGVFSVFSEINYWLKPLWEREKSKDDISDIVYNFVKSRGSAELPKLKEWLPSAGHVIIDDGFDHETLWAHKAIAVYLAIMAMAEQVCPKITVWVALDFYGQNIDETFANDCKSFLSKCHQNSSSILGDSGGYYSVARLLQQMRSTEAVFEVMRRFASWPPELQPVMGHKERGPPVEAVDLQADYLSDAWNAVAERIVSELQTLVFKGFDSKTIAVIVDDWFQPVWSGRLDEEPPSQVFNNNRPGWLAKFDLLIRDAGIECAIIDNYKAVSSLQWPTVIYGGCRYHANSAHSSLELEATYRSISRATTKLIIIFAWFKEISPKSKPVNTTLLTDGKDHDEDDEKNEVSLTKKLNRRKGADLMANDESK